MTAANHLSAVRHACVITVELFTADEVDRGVVVSKVVRHRDDLAFDAFAVSPIGRYNETLAGVLLTRGQLEFLSGTNPLAVFFDRHRVLDSGFDTLDPPDSIGMALRNATTPERVGLPIRQSGLGDNAGQ